MNKTYTIGLLIPDIANPFFASIAQSIEREVRKSQYSFILCDSEENHEREVESIELLKNRKIDGLIVSPVGRESKHLVRIYEGSIPMVTVDRYFPDSNLPFVNQSKIFSRSAAMNLDQLRKTSSRFIEHSSNMQPAGANIDNLSMKNKHLLQPTATKAGSAYRNSVFPISSWSN